MAKNKNITPLSAKDLKNEIPFNKFKYFHYFDHVANLMPNIENEKIDISIIDKEKFSKEGLVYVMVVEGKILKIGQTIKNIKERVNSYNCGKVEYRINGTASTTNYFILQSILKINKTVELYAYYPPAPKIEVFGEEIQTTRPITKVVENKIIEEFEQTHGKKPIGITQK